MYKIINKCRICSNKNLNSVINLGNQPPANSLQKKISKQIQIPLHVVRCSKCSTLQLNATVNPKYLFSKYFGLLVLQMELKIIGLFLLKN